jgi:hypothetical protein
VLVHHRLGVVQQFVRHAAEVAESAFAAEHCRARSATC